MWHFAYSKDKDSDFGEDDSSGVRMQPDHFPNVARPGGGYHKDTIVDSEKPEVFCNKCDDELVDGSCVRCDWGEQNRAVPMPNYPLDPTEELKPGIRAGSWKFSENDPIDKYLTRQGWRWARGYPKAGSKKKEQKIIHENCNRGKWTNIKTLERNVNEKRSLKCENSWCISNRGTPASITDTKLKQYLDKQGWKFAEGYPIRTTKAKQKIIHNCSDNGEFYLEPQMAYLKANALKNIKLQCPNPNCTEGNINLTKWLNDNGWSWEEGYPTRGGHPDQKQEIVHDNCGYIKSTLNIPNLKNYMNREMPLLCENLECEFYQESVKGYNPKKPGQIYVFQVGNSIKVGITNDWDRRKKEYQDPIYQKRRNLETNEFDYFIPPKTNVPDLISLPSNAPSNKELKLRGLEPLNQKSEDLINSKSRKIPGGRPIPESWKEEFERQKEEGILKTKQPSRKKANDELVENNGYAFEPIENGYIPKNIENAIMNWWISLDIAPELESTFYTETISASPQESESVKSKDIAPDLTLDLHVFLIQKMIENGGHMIKLDEIMNQPENQEKLSAFFDNDSDKINAALGMTWDAEQGKYVPGNEFGNAFGVNEPYIPASNWSFEESVEEPTEEQIQDIQTQRAMQLSEDQQKALQAPQLSPNFYGDQRFQEELAKHPEWAETAIPETQIPQDLRSVPRGDYGNFEGIRVNQPYRDPINGDVRMIDENNQQWIAYNGQWVRVAKIQNLWTGF
jgi:hypothetical protein